MRCVLCRDAICAAILTWSALERFADMYTYVMSQKRSNVRPFEVLRIDQVHEWSNYKYHKGCTYQSSCLCAQLSMQRGNTALHYAAQHNGVKCVKILLDHGIDINSKNEVRM